MNTFRKTTLALAALGATMALAPTLQAQSTPAPGASQGQGMGGMGGDMAGMMKMMENCNRMMQSMNNQNPPRETPPATPEQKG